MCADHSDYGKIGGTRITSKLKQENRRRLGRKVEIAGLRTSATDEEMYAVVTKIFGNGMCQVNCLDGQARMCIIRKKFRGRGKFKNQISVGVTVLVGLRDWEKNERSSMEKCDLLEVYSESEVRKLKQGGAVSFDGIAHKSIVTEEGEIEFDADTSNSVGLKDDVAAQPQRDYDLAEGSSDSEEDKDIDVDEI